MNSRSQRSFRPRAVLGALLKCSTLASCLLVIAPQSSCAQVLYDNSDIMIFDDDWLTALGSDVRFAQQFLIGENTNVDQITMKLQRPASGASGSIRFELWRDDGSNRPVPIGDPMAKIADLGQVDVETVPVGTFGEYILDNLIVGLEPNMPYWIVTDFAEVTGISGGEQSVGVAIVDDPDEFGRNPPGFDAAAGTNGAAHIHAYRDADPFWVNLKEVFGLNHFYQAMKVEATAVPEPATSTLLALFGLAALTRCRRFKNRP